MVKIADYNPTRIYTEFIEKQNYAEMYVYQLLEMYADARNYMHGAFPVQGDVNEAVLAEKMIRITNEIELRIEKGGK